MVGQQLVVEVDQAGAVVLGQQRALEACVASDVGDHRIVGAGGGGRQRQLGGGLQARVAAIVPAAALVCRLEV